MGYAKLRIGGQSSRQRTPYGILGKYDNVEDAWMNATGKRRRKLERYRKPEDRANDAAMEVLARDYQRRMREASKQEIQAYAAVSAPSEEGSCAMESVAP